MAEEPDKTGTPVTDKRALIEYFEAGCTDPADFCVGTEHEKFAYRTADHRPLPYDGDPGIRQLLEGLQAYGWRPVHEKGRLVALAGQDHSSVTLEPGGQVELSGAPLYTIHETCREVSEHLRETKAVTEGMGAAMLGLGFQPRWKRSEIPWMPKGRYAIMGRYLPERGTQGLDMMLRTCTVQCNLDYASEADMVAKFRVGLALQPIATALFANSPFADGRPSGFLSHRSQVWMHTDPDRCGILPFVFDEGMGFERWVDYLLDVPMFLVYRDGDYIDAAGQSFRDFLAGRLPALPGEHPTIKDWEDHITTVFPEVRLKRYIEMRGADGGPWSRLCALPALWVGLLYDSDSLRAARDLTADFTAEEHAYLRQTVPVQGLNTPFRGRPLRAWAQDMLAIAEAGLRRRAHHNPRGQDERVFLETLNEIANDGRTPAEELLERYHGPWGGRVDPVFTEYAY